MITDGPAVAKSFRVRSDGSHLPPCHGRCGRSGRDTSVDEEFYNRTDQVLEGTYLFPLPAGRTSISLRWTSTASRGGGAAVGRQGALDLRRDRPQIADPAPDGIRRPRCDEGAHLPDRGQQPQTHQAQYTQLLHSDAGSRNMFIRSTRKNSAALPLGDVSIAVNLHCTKPIKSLYCPSHNVTDSSRWRDRPRQSITASARSGRIAISSSSFRRRRWHLGINLLTCKTSGGDGDISCSSPRRACTRRSRRSQAKDICFVLDTSGSMAGPKIEQAKKALQFLPEQSQRRGSDSK